MKIFRTIIFNTCGEEYVDCKHFKRLKDPCIISLHHYWSNKFGQHSKHWIYKKLQKKIRKKNNLVISIFVVVQINVVILINKTWKKIHMTHMKWTSLMLSKANHFLKNQVISFLGIIYGNASTNDEGTSFARKKTKEKGKKM